MDVLNDILDTLNLKGVLYFRTNFSAPWAATVPDLEQAARFHLVVQGSCRVEFSSGAAVTLAAGDLVLIPKGRSHVLADQPGRTAPTLETVLESVNYDGEGVLVVGDGDPNATTQMVCGHFNFRSGADHPILRALPEYFVTTTSMRARQPLLDEMLRLVAQRAFSEDIGSAAAVTRLSEIVFIELLRAGIDRSDGLTSILEAFRDRQIGQALQLIHARPGDPWTVDGLASDVGMSRSRFAERFSALMGTGPMAYLADWRLQKALSLLDESGCSVQQVASQTGYQSPAAFTRAFSGKFGMPPTEYRRKAA
ncbi:MAG: AraC family transcriptional regulator [Rhodospirillaceae bacterium]|nr:AraC family transcriptional regulator [Rhodospirillaceae bacterium]MBT5564229.1 AraC family transcriptional regulator [Rhodospirillaceae bacterium]MBT6088794.1 AraC family transcriptional regulator [Rhodospirillaceae bacterium]MBT7449910.1 AraC family transcriptional regulator [Rhodospirillaceae bacterium]